jgi:hypothetical protein
MPQSWLVWCVSKVEPGLQVALLVSYLARALSLLFVLVGLLMIKFAKDVRRYYGTDKNHSNLVSIRHLFLWHLCFQ